MKAILFFFLILPFFIFAQNQKINQEPTVQKFKGNKDQYQLPNPGPNASEKKKWLGKFKVYLSSTNEIWNDKILLIKKITEVPVKDIFPALETEATISVPLGWDEQKPVSIEISFQLHFDGTDKKTKIVKIFMGMVHHLSTMNEPQKYEFEGAYIDEIKGFAGTYLVNSVPKGYFLALKK